MLVEEVEAGSSVDRTRRARSVSPAHVVRQLGTRGVPAPPPTQVRLALVGFDAATSGPLRDRASAHGALVEMTPTVSVRASAVVVDADRDGWLDVLRALREAGDQRPAIVVASDATASICRQAYFADARVLRSPLEPADLEPILAAGRRHDAACFRARSLWASEDLAPWVESTLAPVELTPKRYQVLALAVVFDRREDIARALGVRVKRVERQITSILRSLNQLYRRDVVDLLRELFREAHGRLPFEL